MGIVVFFLTIAIKGHCFTRAWNEYVCSVCFQKAATHCTSKKVCRTVQSQRIAGINIQLY